MESAIDKASRAQFWLALTAEGDLLDRAFASPNAERALWRSYLGSQHPARERCLRYESEAQALPNARGPVRKVSVKRKKWRTVLFTRF